MILSIPMTYKFNRNIVYLILSLNKFYQVGRLNPQVGLRVFKINNLRSEAWSIPAPVDVVGIDHILGRVNWASDHNLIVLWLNRRQSISVLINCDLQLDKCSILKEHRETNGWIDITQPYYDYSGTRMVEIQPLYNGDQRFFHAARFNLITQTTEDLSPGNSTVTDILGWDEDKDIVYYILSPENIPWQRQLWSASKGSARCISCKESACHSTSAMFSPGAKLAVVTCSATNTVPKIFLYNSEVSNEITNRIPTTSIYLTFISSSSSFSIFVSTVEEMKFFMDKSQRGRRISFVAFVFIKNRCKTISLIILAFLLLHCSVT
jgi:hypothetical protein